jgi:hypothetical protein
MIIRMESGNTYFKTKILVPMVLLSLTFVLSMTATVSASSSVIYVNGSHGNNNWDGLSGQWQLTCENRKTLFKWIKCNSRIPVNSKR